MKKYLGLLICLLTVLLTACNSFDADGYVKALLDNTYKGESSDLIKFSSGQESEIAQIHQDAVNDTCAGLLSGAAVSDSLLASYQSFVTDMMNRADYTVDSCIKNDDGSYTVTITTRRLVLTVNDTINAQTDTYIKELQSQVETGNASISEEELQEHTYEIMLQCYEDALQNAVYEDSVAHTVEVTKSGYTYNASETDLSNISQNLFFIQ